MIVVSASCQDDWPKKIVYNGNIGVIFDTIQVKEIKKVYLKLDKCDSSEMDLLDRIEIQAKVIEDKSNAIDTLTIGIKINKDIVTKCENYLDICSRENKNLVQVVGKLKRIIRTLAIIAGIELIVISILIN